jgi:hypothetical protein
MTRNDDETLKAMTEHGASSMLTLRAVYALGVMNQADLLPIASPMRNSLLDCHAGLKPGRVGKSVVLPTRFRSFYSPTSNSHLSPAQSAEYIPSAAKFRWG